MAERMTLEVLKPRLHAAESRWAAAENNMTQYTAEQIKGFLGGALPPGGITVSDMEPLARSRQARANIARANLLAGAAVAPLPPPQFDWRNNSGKNFVTSVKFQGQCGACTAFSSAAAIESAICIQTATPPSSAGGIETPDLSEAQIFYCGGGAAGRTCASGWFLPAALEYCQVTGVAPESFFPYTSGDQSCGLKSGWQAKVTRTTGDTRLKDVQDIKQWIATRGPVAVMLIVYSDFIYYATGVYHHVTGDQLGLHSMCIVGYDDTSSAWICKNSWSAQWGEQGFVNFGYGECGIESAVHGINGLQSIGT